jgi:hypothetical protein
MKNKMICDYCKQPAPFLWKFQKITENAEEKPRRLCQLCQAATQLGETWAAKKVCEKWFLKAVHKLAKKLFKLKMPEIIKQKEQYNEHR